MLKKIHLENFMLLQKQQLEFGQINIFAGVNDTGKTSLLKLIYASIKAREESKNRKIKNFFDHLSSKIINVFGIERLSELVTKSQEKLKVELYFSDHSHYEFSFSSKTSKNIVPSSNLDQENFGLQTVFIPPKEVLTLRNLIRTTIEQYNFKGYDDTYYDLVKALDVPIHKGKRAKVFSEIDKELEIMLSGRIISIGNDFVFKKGKYKYSISLTAEGIKKIGIFNQLLKNKTIQNATILIIDEPEMALHPQIISKFSKMLYDLSNAGVQIFMATHSYFVIKSFQILAQKHKSDVFLFNMVNSQTIAIEKNNLKEGMPSNEIIDSSITLFEAESKIKFNKLGI